MHSQNVMRTLWLATAALVLAACSDASPLRPDSPGKPNPAPGMVQASLECTVSTVEGSLTCSDAPSVGGASGAIIGGQGLYVQLASTNHTTTADTFSIDVTVTNLIPQSLGTTNGSTADPAGIRVFFVDEPSLTEGTGDISVANADGTATFTAVEQPYHQYNGVLQQDSTSAVKPWKFQLDPGVTRFSFRVLVSAAVQYPNGYIDGNYYVLTLDPGESRTLPGTARTLTGVALPVQNIDWVSNAPGTAAVAGSQVTAGASRGTTQITGTSGARSTVYATAVSVCQAAVVTSGTSLPSSISSSDCFSSYGSNSGQPSTSYYADLFRVTLTAGQTLTVTMDSNDDLDTYLLLAAPGTGFLVAGNDDDEEGPLGVGSRMVYTATTTGVYVIEASTFNGLDTGDYTLGITIS